MSSKTKIVVLHMKEIIYTAIFVILGMLLLLLLIFMFSPKKKSLSTSAALYTPGTYTSAFPLGSSQLEVEVTVDAEHINAVRFRNLTQSVTTAYPLIQPAMENIADQVCKTQSLEDLSYGSENAYTSQVIIDAIDSALEKARAD